METLAEKLRNNECVSIIGDHHTSHGIGIEFLGTNRRFATGAPRLAQMTGAALLTIYSSQVAPFRYRVIVEPPIAVGSASGRAGQSMAIARFASRLGRHVKAHPADWDEWSRSGPSS